MQVKVGSHKNRLYWSLGKMSRRSLSGARNKPSGRCLLQGQPAVMTIKILLILILFISQNRFAAIKILYTVKTTAGQLSIDKRLTMIVCRFSLVCRYGLSLWSVISSASEKSCLRQPGVKISPRRTLVEMTSHGALSGMTRCAVCQFDRRGCVLSFRAIARNLV